MLFEMIRNLLGGIDKFDLLGGFGFGDSDEVVNDSGQGITDENGEEEEGHDEGFHLRHGLGVGELKADDGDEDFGDGEDEVGEKLPGDAGSFAAVDGFLGERDDGEGGGHEEEAGPDFTKRGELDDLSDSRINDEGEEGNEDENEEGIGGLDLGGKDGEAEDFEIHFFGLEDEGGRGLVKEAPEHGDENIEEDH